MDHVSASCPPPSGGATDRPIERKRIWKKPGVLLFCAAVATGIGIFATLAPRGGRTLKLAANGVTLAEVSRGLLEDTIPVRGRVVPLRTVYLDTIEGGRVEKVHVEDGAQVQAGQVLVELSNTAIQLDIISREAQVFEQLNALRNLEFTLEQNRIQYQRETVELQYQLTRLRRRLLRGDRLFSQGNIAEAELTDVQDEYEAYQHRLDVSTQAQRSYQHLRETQVAEIKAAAVHLQQNLAAARSNLQNLTIRAPVSGQITALKLEVGQSVARAERIGQIDDSRTYKLAALVDEFYLARVDAGQSATLEWMEKAFELKVSKVHPQVRDGQFETNLEFVGAQPPGLRRGQTLQAKLTLGESTRSLLIPNGPFFQDTGGAWVFVLSSNGTRAVRRSVRLGRRNSQLIEVLDGLSVGERVVISSYSGFTDKDRLDLVISKQ